MRDWESTFVAWTKPPSETEEEKCSRALAMVREAIRASPNLSSRRIEIFTQGSYRNNTHVRLDSVVDVCVRCMEPFYTDYTYATDLNDSELGLTTSSYTFQEFKNEVGDALFAHFGKGGVSRGNKAFDVHANTARVDADVVATFEHRAYVRGSNGAPLYVSGTQFLSDEGKKIVNWPEQNYENGVKKNDATLRRYKRLVRLFKKLRFAMLDAQIATAEPIPSYLIECLVWNVPDPNFGLPTYTEIVRNSLLHLWRETKDSGTSKTWSELNRLKSLFSAAQPWTALQVHAFAEAAWNYIGYK